ncbi:M14 family zinc carboxypeptidase [Actinomadura chokoriensis]|uniref:M14 family zinc carboxypeptidase n=1 Tax=Actinomadura chokoriensis TaxID=454156 RepID=UPI0031F74542
MGTLVPAPADAAGGERRGQRKRPVVVYQAAQHAREWITPEMVRRLLHHYVDGYGTDAELTKIVDTTELWFIPVVNVDGYDLTFQDGFRLWRKNVRDNNGDGQITGADGTDLNRNFPYKRR